MIMEEGRFYDASVVQCFSFKRVSWSQVGFNWHRKSHEFNIKAINGFFKVGGREGVQNFYFENVRNIPIFVFHGRTTVTQ